MRIAGSNVAMASKRTYVEQGKQTVQSAKTNLMEMMGKGLDIASRLSDGGKDTFTLSSGNDDVGTGIYNTYDKNHNVGNVERTGAKSVAEDGSLNLRNSLLGQLLNRFSQAGFANMSGLSGMNGIGNSMGVVGTQSVSEMSYYEYEQTSFSAQGQATTEDGRIIDFSINVEMTRSFSMYTQTQIPLLRRVFMDPLMVNVGSGVASISDQKFKFDLDMDGTEDEISMPTKGSGFLALDINEDGKINDGSELFGTQSGDGFKDLAKYDSDGNGWIDENDEIFEKLRVWYKNEDGEDELINLKEADIGAIYLGEQSTTFKLQGSDMSTNGMIRSTGIFLHESTGLAGTIQHVDLAVKGAQEIGDAQVYPVLESEMEGDSWSGKTSERAASESDTKTSETEEKAEASRRRERRLKKRQQEEERLAKRREEQERMDELREKQIERREELEAIREKKRARKEAIEELHEETLAEKKAMEELREETMENSEIDAKEEEVTAVDETNGSQDVEVDATDKGADGTAAFDGVVDAVSAAIDGEADALTAADGVVEEAADYDDFDVIGVTAA